MPLTLAGRRDLWAAFMAEVSRRAEAISITKTELRAAIDAVDAWIDANMTALNAALPQPARSRLTDAQRAALLAAVAQARAGGR